MIIGGDGSIYRAEKIREYDVKITETKWQPPIPNEYDSSYSSNNSAEKPLYELKVNM